ncbi:MAG: STAS domain-containing protein [Acidimicrobiia bacterium]
MSAPAHEPESETLATVDFETTTGAGDDEWIVTVHGEIDVATSPRLRTELHDCLERGARTIVLDLEAMSFIDSSGLGVLVGVVKRLKDQQGDTIMLCNLQEPVRRVFEITGLTELFRIEN